MAWMTPFEVVTSGCDDPGATDEDVVAADADREPLAVQRLHGVTLRDLGRGQLPSATWNSSTERSVARLRASRASVASGTLAKAASVGAKTVYGPLP